LTHRVRPYAKRQQLKRFARSGQRKKKKKRSGFFKFYFAVVRSANLKGKKHYDLPKFKIYDDKYDYKIKRLPERGDNIAFIADIPEAFDKSKVVLPADGKFIV
jgi:hypothetical protein